MNILIVTDAYPPMRTSGACHIYDLGQAFVIAGSQANIIVPDSAQEQDVNIHVEDGVKVIRVKALHTKDIGYFQRTIAEFLNPFLIWHRLKQNPQFLQEKIDGVVWYSPTIFWGPLIARLKKQFQAKSYLILRDLFPDWALDLGIIKKGPSYSLLKIVEHYQYQQADIIGVQSTNNLKYFVDKHPTLKSRTEVLWNWGIVPQTSKNCSIDLSLSSLSGRVICVYAGNMGVAQDINVLVELAASLQNRHDLGFVFVGRGSEVEPLRERIKQMRLTNILFFDEIDSAEIPGLYIQCDIGMMTLDLRHKSHNIPGKFIGYLYAGLPVFSIINDGNDLFEIIKLSRIGVATSTHDIRNLQEKLIALLDQIKHDQKIHARCQELGYTMFSAKIAGIQIIKSLQNYHDSFE